MQTERAELSNTSSFRYGLVFRRTDLNEWMDCLLKELLVVMIDIAFVLAGTGVRPLSVARYSPAASAEDDGV